jgi:hypothetical protein
MANRKISDLTALTAPVTGDLLPIVDISEAAAADKNKKITYGTFLSSVPLGTAAAPSIAFTGDNTGIYSPGADQVAVATNGSGRLFVDSTGNIGIGEASPSTFGKLTVLDGTINIVSNSISKRLSFWSTNNTNSENAYIQSQNDGVTTNTGQIIFATKNTAASLAERVRITAEGLVGIGSSLPSAKLDVEASNFAGGPAIGVRYNTSNVRLGFNVANSNGFTYIGSNTNNKLSSDSATYDLTGQAASQLRLDGGQLIFNNAPSGTAGNDITFTNRLTITSAGLVGIGTTSPGTNLDVNGTVRMRIAGGGTDRYVDIGSDGSGTTRFYNNYAGGGDFGFTWRIGASDRMTLDSSGRLLVGTSSDSGGALLQVNGDRIRVGTAKTPASASDTGTAGEICWDASYIYVCTATNTWKRTAIATW